MQCLWFLLTLYVCQSTEWSSHISRFFHFLCLWTWERFWSIRTSSFLNHSFLLTWLYSLISLAPSGAFLLAVPLKSCCCAVLTHIYLGPEGLSAVFFFFFVTGGMAFCWIKHSTPLSHPTPTLSCSLSWFSSQPILLCRTRTCLSSVSKSVLGLVFICYGWHDRFLNQTLNFAL